MRARNNISFEELIDKIMETGFHISSVSSMGCSVQRVRIFRNGFAWLITRREWNSPMGKRFVRFSAELLRLPEDAEWKGSQRLYTRRDGRAKSFPCFSQMPITTLNYLLRYLDREVSKYE